MHRRWEFIGTVICIVLILTAVGCQKTVLDPGAAMRAPAGTDETGAGGDLSEENLTGQTMIDEGPADEIVTADGVVMNRERFINQVS